MRHFVQPTPVPVLDVSFNANLSALPAALTALGFTYTCSSVRYYWDGAAFQQLAANAFHTSYNPTTGTWGYFPEPSFACITKWSCDFSNAVWVKSGGLTRANATSCISGQVASKLTAAAASDYITQVGSTSASVTQITDTIIEQGTATVSKIATWDGTNSQIVGDAIITWATGVVTSTLGTATGFSLVPTGQLGPNGGKLFKLASTIINATSGIIRSVRVFPDTSGGGGYCYLHHATTTASATGLTMSPVVTSGGNVTRSAMIFTSTTFISVIPALKTSFGISMVANVNFPYHLAATRVFSEVSDGTSTNRIVFRINTTNNPVAVSTGTTTVTLTSPFTTPSMQNCGVGVSSRAAYVSVCQNNKIHAVFPNTNAMPTLTQFHIGNTEASANQLCGYITRIRVYNYLNPQQLAKVSL